MKKISIVSIPVSDQEISSQFYGELGFEVMVKSPMGNNQTWLQMGFPGTEVSITLVTWFQKMQPGSFHGLVVVVDDIQQELEQLAAKAIPTGKIDETPWGKFLTITDPDGNSIILQQP